MSASMIAEWRQCSCFFLDDHEKLRDEIRKEHQDTNGIYIILTHSCSVSIGDFDKEPLAEYILARPIDAISKEFIGRRLQRILHLELCNEGEVKYFELKIHERGFFNRKTLNEFAPKNRIISEENAALLIRWMASRYSAPAFPNEFNNRFKEPLNKLQKELKKNDGQSIIMGTYIILEPDNEELKSDESYELEIIFAVDANSSDGTLEECESLAKMMGLDNFKCH